jgi:hypothetical protein
MSFHEAQKTLLENLDTLLPSGTTSDQSLALYNLSKALLELSKGIQEELVKIHSALEHLK